MKKISAAILAFAMVFVSCGGKNKTVRTISVTGTGEVKLENEKSVISLSVQTRNAEVVKASEENSQKMEKVYQALMEKGIDRSSIQTADFYITQESSYVNGKNIPGLYLVSNRIKVSVSDAEKTGIIIDAAIHAGANKFDSLEFQTGRTEDAEKQARILAIRNAEQKALTLVSTSGNTLGKVVSISENSAGRGRMTANAVMLKAEATDYAAPVSAGTSSVSVNVSVVYEIQ